MSNNHPKRIHLPGNALEKLQSERMEKIQSYLDELGKHASIANADLDLVVRAAIEHHGLPKSDGERLDLIAAADRLAALLTQQKLRALNNGVKEVMKLHNVSDVPAHILWSARRAGVELLDPQQASEATPEAR